MRHLDRHPNSSSGRIKSLLPGALALVGLLLSNPTQPTLAPAAPLRSHQLLGEVAKRSPRSSEGEVDTRRKIWRRRVPPTQPADAA